MKKNPQPMSVAEAWERVSKRYPRILARLAEHERAEGVRE